MTLPVSLGALRTFVEVGRQGGIKRAAKELNVTPGAVSQQIRALEDRFGVRLLERGNREVKLSAHGLRLYSQIAPGFDQIDAAVQSLVDRRPGPGTLVVSTTPSFAACWLVPRLGDFTKRHPGIEVRIESSARLADLSADPVDVAIRHGSGTYPGLDATLLFRPFLVPIASPSLLPDGPLPSPEDCLRYPLLQDRDRADWSFWFQAHGIRPLRTATKGPGYADDALLIQAAISGQGLAVVRDVYAARALDAGSVILAVDAPVATQAGYYVVTSAKKTGATKVSAFRTWIMQQAGTV